LVRLEDRLAPATVNWTGMGHDLNWGSAANWDLHLPGNGDDAVIGSNFAGQTITSSGNVGVRSVSSAATLELNVGSLSLGAGTSVMNADLRVDALASVQLGNATLNGTGTFINAGTVDLRTSTVNLAVQNQGLLRADSDITIETSIINGAIANPQGGTIRVMSPYYTGVNLIVAHGFTNHGLLDIASTNYQSGDATLTVASGMLTNAADGTITCSTNGAGRRVINAPLDNQGTIITSAATVIAPSPGAFTNSGRIEVGPGPGSFTVNQLGLASSSNSGTIDLAGGDLNIAQASATSTFTNTGTITAVPGHITPSTK
jgi:hypothetical protein